MKRIAAILVAATALTGCAGVPILGRLGGGAAPPQYPDVVPPGTAVAGIAAPPTAVTARPASLDTVSEAEKAAARAAAAAAPSGGVLGQETVALGSPADAGLWVKSALVTRDTAGTVRTGSGDAIAVTLRPLGDGAGGAQISLPALRALGLPLTGLHPVTLAAS